MTTYFFGLASILVISIVLILLGIVITKVAEQFNELPELVFGACVVVLVAYFMFWELPMLVGSLVMQAIK